MEAGMFKITIYRKYIAMSIIYENDFAKSRADF